MCGLQYLAIRDRPENVLDEVSQHQIWRVLHKHGIHLQHPHSWCISADTQFTQKVRDVVGLHFNLPEKAVVIRVDEKPGIQTLECAQGWLRLPDGRAMRGFSHKYKRQGTASLFATMDFATGLVHTGHNQKRKRHEFLDFMRRIDAQSLHRESNIILDNLNIHEPKHDRWLSRYSNVCFQYTPTHYSWLNQVQD